MSYKTKHIFCLTALAMILSMAVSADVRAQGVVTLADEAAEDPALKGIPNEDALFEDDNDKVIPIEDPKPVLSIPSKDVPTPSSDNGTVVPVSASSAPISVNGNGALFGQAQDNPASKSLGAPGVGALGERDFTALDDNVFSTMSALEKQTAVLDLELRKERLKNEIEALINQRKAAVTQEEEKQEAKRRQKIEWEKAQEAKVVQEQQKLREMDITFEKLRQEKMLNAYKNKVLEDQQKWIAENAKTYEQLKKLNQEKQGILDDVKGKLQNVNTALKNASQQASDTKRAYLKDIADLHTQISVLKARIEAQDKELLEKQNPFADASDQDMSGADGVDFVSAPSASVQEITVPELKLPNMYAVMEIRGQGDELIAKLINQEGTPFYVKKGTSLQSGHIVDDITSTYVRADKNGIKDYLYFAAGGILPMELSNSAILPKANTDAFIEEKTESLGRTFISSDGVPGMGTDMMAR